RRPPCPARERGAIASAWGKRRWSASLDDRRARCGGCDCSHIGAIAACHKPRLAARHAAAAFGRECLIAGTAKITANLLNLGRLGGSRGQFALQFQAASRKFPVHRNWEKRSPKQRNHSRKTAKRSS